MRNVRLKRWSGRRNGDSPPQPIRPFGLGSLFLPYGGREYGEMSVYKKGLGAFPLLWCRNKVNIENGNLLHTRYTKGLKCMRLMPASRASKGLIRLQKQELRYHLSRDICHLTGGSLNREICACSQVAYLVALGGAQAAVI